MSPVDIDNLKIGEPERFLNLCEIIACVINNCPVTDESKCVVSKIIRETSLLATECKMLNGNNKNNAPLISPAALEIKNNGLESRNLTLEHGVPVSVISKEVLKLEKPTATDVASVIYSYVALAVITNEEDKRIDKLGLRSKMPNGWNNDKYIRYKLAGIELIDNPHKK